MKGNHLKLAGRILDFAEARGLGIGAPLPEQQLADFCTVSRTPVRSALSLLLDFKVVERQPEGGYRLTMRVAAARAVLDKCVGDDAARLARHIVRDRVARRLNATVTVADLLRRYDASRTMVRNALKVLEIDELIERAPGQAWVFRPMLDTSAAHAESYAYRLLLEPAAMLEEGFALDPFAASDLRDRHLALHDLPDAEFGSDAFEALDFDFHATFAEASGNRFVAQSLLPHLRLRALSGDAARPTTFRLRTAIEEHLRILDDAVRGQVEVAADLMRVHLRLSARQRPAIVNRGAPPLEQGALARRGAAGGGASGTGVSRAARAVAP